MSKKEIVKLPSRITVKFFKGSSGKWVVELPKYDIVAQVNSEGDMDYMVNELVFTHFDLSDKFKQIIRYVPRNVSKKTEKVKSSPLIFQKFVASRFAVFT